MAYLVDPEEVFGPGGEGDAWFDRNFPNAKELRLTPLPHWFKEAFGLLKEIANPQGKFLEVGSSWGRRTAQISSVIGLQGVGVDPSKKAVAFGNAQFGGNPQLRVGTASQLPLSSQSVSVVFYGFCLYLLPDRQLPRVIEELNRVAKSQHHVAILDFDFPREMRVPYKHREGLFSYRRPYEELMKAEGYSLISKTPLVGDWPTEVVGVAPNPMDRKAVWIFER